MRKQKGNYNVWTTSLDRQWSDSEEDLTSFTFFLRINLWLFKKEKMRYKKKSFIELNILKCSTRSRLEAQLSIKCITRPLNYPINHKSLKMNDLTHKSSKEASKLNMKFKETLVWINMNSLNLNRMCLAKHLTAKNHIQLHPTVILAN